MTTEQKRKAAQYPRIVGMAKDMTPQWGRRPRFCAYCHDPATHRITMAVNHLPGENETRDVCAVHAVALPDNAEISARRCDGLPGYRAGTELGEKP